MASTSSRRAPWRRAGAAFVEAAAVGKLAGGIEAEEVGRAQRAVGPRHRLVLVVEIGEGELVGLGEALHVGKGVLRMRPRIVGADRGKAEALRLQRGGVLHEPVDHGFDIGAVVADEGDHRPLGAGDIGQRVSLAIGGGQPEIGSRQYPGRLCALLAAMTTPPCQRALLGHQPRQAVPQAPERACGARRSKLWRSGPIQPRKISGLPPRRRKDRLGARGLPLLRRLQRGVGGIDAARHGGQVGAHLSGQLGGGVAVGVVRLGQREIGRAHLLAAGACANPGRGADRSRRGRRGAPRGWAL